MLQVKWVGVLHNVLNDHEWLNGVSEHDMLSTTDMNGLVLEYFSREQPAFRVLKKLVMDQNWLKSLPVSAIIYCEL